MINYSQHKSKIIDFSMAFSFANGSTNQFTPERAYEISLFFSLFGMRSFC